MPRLRFALVLFGLAGVVLAALFVVLQPGPEPAPGAPGAVQTFDFVVKRGELASGPELIQAREGETLRFRISSDQRDHWHLHGYDLELTLEAGKAAELSFTANRSGRFEHELHRSHRTLGVLEVLPR